MVASPNPEFRRRVHVLAEEAWREPVVVVYLWQVKPDVHVPGRRRDGSVKGERLVRRFFWNILRGTVGGLVSAVLSVMGGGAANMFHRYGRLAGPENSLALPLLDASRSADSPWLVYSESRVAVVETGHTFYDPDDAPPPEFRWQAQKPDAPEVDPRRRTLKWPDGSVYEYYISLEERQFLKAAGHA